MLGQDWIKKRFKEEHLSEEKNKHLALSTFHIKGFETWFEKKKDLCVTSKFYSKWKVKMFIPNKHRKGDM